MTDSGLNLAPQSLISLFLDYTNGLPTPHSFRLWSAIGLVSAALERRCWAVTASSRVYPNLFVLLVGRPGVGKTQSITPAIALARESSNIVLAPDDATKASLVDTFLDTASRKRITIDNDLYEYSSIFSCAHELGVLIKEHDMEFLNFMSAMWDCPEAHKERRRSRTDNQVYDINRPTLTFLAGTTPGYLSSLLPEVAWSQGFMARIICVYSSEVVRPPLFGTIKDNSHLRKKLLLRLQEISALQGEFTFSPEAMEALTDWYEQDCPPKPTHGRLVNYSVRRMLQVLKLSMIFSASANTSLLIELSDVTNAIEVLLTAETKMPDIFLEMSTNSDAHVIQGLHYYATTQYNKTKKPLHRSRLLNYLSNHVPAWRAIAILDFCHDSNIITRSIENPEFFIPKPRLDLHNDE